MTAIVLTMVSILSLVTPVYQTTSKAKSVPPKAKQTKAVAVKKSVTAKLPSIKTISYPLPDGRAPFVEKIPNSVVSFDMLPVPALPDGRKMFMSKFEIQWDVYDIFAYRLDLTESEKAAGVDAAARPSKPYGAPDRGFGHKGYSCLGMHYQSALKFVEWLSKKTGKKYRLPTEEEWQWAATSGEKPAVLSAKELGKVAWYWDNAGDKAMEVGKLLPNPWGFYDMLGNVAEWCHAPAGTPYNEEPARGGCWKDKVKDVQYTAVQFWQPDWQLADAQIPKSKWWLSDGPYVGIRVVCDAE